MSQSGHEKDNPHLMTISLYVGFTFVFIAAVMIGTLLYFEGSVSQEKIIKQNSQRHYNLKVQDAVDKKNLEGIDKAMDTVVKRYSQ